MNVCSELEAAEFFAPKYFVNSFRRILILAQGSQGRFKTSSGVITESTFTSGKKWPKSGFRNV